MKNWHRNLIFILIFIGLIVLVIAAPVYGQSGDCGGASGCVDSSDFDTGLDGWVASYEGVTPTVDVIWLASKSFGWLWWQTNASGVATMQTNGSYDLLHADQRVGMRKSFQLTPGRYVLVTRIAADRPSSSVVYYNIDGFGAVNTARILGFWDTWQVLRTDDVNSNSFSVLTAGNVTVVLSADYRSMTYLDYIYLLRLSDATPYPSSTPGLGTPTALPGATSTPMPPSATPIATGTAYCVPAPSTPTPGIPGDTSPTATPTALPAAIGWSYYDGFDQALSGTDNFWVSAGSGVDIAYNVGHRALNAVGIPNSADPGGGSLERPALIYRPGGFITSTFYIDAWAQASYVAEGRTQYLEVWTEDSGTALWSKAGEVAISHRLWYPSHWTITSAGSISAVAFVARRSDDVPVDKVYLDDVYLYGDLSLSPYCDGTFPPNTVFIGLDDNTPYQDGVTLSVSADRECPAAILRPNNLWGMILAQLTFFLDQLTALAPGHIPGQTRDMVQQYMLSPVGGLILLATIILDWNVPIIMLEIYIAFQGGLAVIGIWKTIRRAFIV